MKPFDLEAAKAGAKVITRGGNPVRILATDMKHHTYKIVGLVDFDFVESLKSWTIDGKYAEGDESMVDLFMAPVKKEYWVAVVHSLNWSTVTTSFDVYSSEEEAINAWRKNPQDSQLFIKAIKIHEEEV